MTDLSRRQSAQTDRLVAEVAAGLTKGRYYSILGPKYSGKTQLIQNVFALLNTQGVFLTVCFDLATVSFLTTDQLLMELCEAVETAMPNPIPQVAASVMGLPAVERIEQAVAGVQPQIILAIDHLECIPEYAGRVLLGSLRTLFVDRPMKPELRNLTVVIAAASSIYHLTVGERSPFNIAEVIWMQDLQSDDALKLIGKWCGSSNISVTKPAAHHIVHMSGSNVSLINSIMKLAIARQGKSRRRRVGKADIDSIIGEVIAGETRLGSLETCLQSVEGDPLLLDSVVSLIEGEDVADLEATPDITRLEASGAVRPRSRSGHIQSDLELRSPIHRRFLTHALTSRRLSGLYARFARWEKALHYAARAVDEEGVDRSLVQATGLGAIAQAATLCQLLRFLEIAIGSGFDVSGVEAWEITAERDLQEALAPSKDARSVTVQAVKPIQLHQLQEAGFIPLAVDAENCRIFVAIQQEPAEVVRALVSFMLPHSLAEYTKHKPLVMSIRDYTRSAATAIAALTEKEAARGIIAEASARLVAALDGQVVEQKVFLAHPYAPRWRNRLYKELLPLLTESAGLRVVHPLDYPGGGELWSGIAAMLQECEAGFFELTILNENVCFELGFCIATLTPYYILRDTEYGDPEGLPSLVKSQWWVEYKSNHSLAQRIRSTVDSAGAAPFFFRNAEIMASLPSRPRTKKVALVTAEDSRVRDDLEPLIIEAANEAGKEAIPVHVEEFHHAYELLARIKSCGFHCAILAPDAGKHSMQHNAETCIAIGMMASVGKEKRSLILQEKGNRIPSDLLAFSTEYENVDDCVRKLGVWLEV